MKDPYSVIGARKGDDRQELLKKYKTLRSKYESERSLSGDAGNDAKRKLHEVDEAWHAITQEIGEVVEQPQTADPKPAESKSGVVEETKGFFKEVDSAFDKGAQKIKESSVGKELHEVGEGLGKTIDDFFGSIFGGKKK